MPRGAKKSEPLTQLMHDGGHYKDARSFMGWDEFSVPHEFLYGVDKSNRREVILWRARHRCQYRDENGKQCQARENLEWHHIKSGLSGRCDCPHNGVARCHAHHSPIEHAQLQSAKIAAAKDFDAVNPPEEQ